jgi:glutaredoxin
MLIKKIISGFFVFLLIFGVAANASAQNTSKIYIFHGTRCPYCGKVKRFFNKENLYVRYPVEKKEIYFDQDNAFLYKEIFDELGVAKENHGVPSVIIGDMVIVDKVLESKRSIIRKVVDTIVGTQTDIKVYGHLPINTSIIATLKKGGIQDVKFQTKRRNSRTSQCR